MITHAAVLWGSFDRDFSAWRTGFASNFVDRVLGIRSHTIHEITLSYTKQHEIRVFVQSLAQPLVRL